MNDADKAREQLTAKYLREIEEFCDGCQILISGQEADGNTFSYEGGVGNWHARLWIANKFVNEHSDTNGELEMFISGDNDEGEEEEED